MWISNNSNVLNIVNDYDLKLIMSALVILSSLFLYISLLVFYLFVF